MILVRLYGGLGNQMFQYAAGIRLSNRLKTNLYIDNNWFFSTKDREDLPKRQYDLWVFGIRPRAISLRERYQLKIRPFTVFKEKNYAYDPEFEKLKGNVIIDGYWQSYKYLLGERSKLLGTYKFPEIESSANKKVLGQIKGTNSISLHVRRGDYINNRNTLDYHGLMSLDYYKKAVDLLRREIENPHIFVFSDDIGWCQKNLKLKIPMTFVKQDHDTHAVEDLRLMSICKSNIVANSSFSWWGAWLNTSPGKKVVAPKLWFANAKHNTKDLLPTEWIKI